MEFHTFGDKSKKPLLVMHGMLCDWRKFYEKLKLLQEEYYLIFPAMSGFYDGAGDFVPFLGESRYAFRHFVLRCQKINVRRVIYCSVNNSG